MEKIKYKLLISTTGASVLKNMKYVKNLLHMPQVKDIHLLLKTEVNASVGSSMGCTLVLQPRLQF